MKTITPKNKIKYVCNNCGSESPRWSGKCVSCNEWNTLVEEVVTNFSKGKDIVIGNDNEPISISEICQESQYRISTNIKEFDRLLGGGIVPGAFMLIGGEPGIGKSTILLQIANQLSLKDNKKILYVTGEESLGQIKSRANRLKVNGENLFILSEVNFSYIKEHIKKINPDIVIVDSIQIVYREDIPSSPGTVVQVRECSNDLMQLAKSTNIPIFVVGHVTKDGSIAGPKVLEHIVDAVFYFEGDRHHSFRILRAVKNRFGSTNEIAVFEMQERGLIEVGNPSEMFLSEEGENISGSVIVASVEGTRPLLLELQALLTPSHSVGMPRRVSTFIDNNRVALLIAIFEKVLGIKIGGYDVFINLVGGIKVAEPALDLGVIIAMLSSLKNVPVNKHTMAIGEVGLGGEVRAVSHIEKRISEAYRLGFINCIIPYKNYKKGLSAKKDINLIPVKSIEEIETSFMG